MATRSRRFAATWLLVCAIACSDTGPPAGPQEEQPDTMLTPDAIPTPLAGGATTVFSVRADAYSQVAPNLAGDLFGLH